MKLNKSIAYQDNLSVILPFVVVIIISLSVGVGNQYYQDSKPAEALDIQSIANWSYKYKNVPSVTSEIRKAAEDNEFTVGEYYNILSKVVAYDNKQREKNMNKLAILQEIKSNVE